MWYQLQCEHCQENMSDALTDALEETGAVSVTLSDQHDCPVLEPAPGETPLWPVITVTALYDNELLAKSAETLIKAQYPMIQVTFLLLEDQDWERTWMDNFKPQCFGERLWICPSWLTPPDPKAINLILDPGLAFGTGTHPTTALCLKWLDSAPLDAKTMIDYGCGSGILALAALKLGASFVHAVDIDEQAIIATQNNAEVNQIDNTQLNIGFPEALSYQTELLIANILLGPLASLKDRFSQLLKPEGILVVSGILEEQCPSLIKAYEDTFTHQLTKTQEEWGLMVFTKH